MKEITCQYRNKVLVPFGEYDQYELSDEYKTNQLVKVKVTKIGKGMEPSIEANNLLHACFAEVLENREFKSFAHVKEACKIDIDFRDMGYAVVRPDGGIQFKYRSYSFKSLPAGPERDRVINQSLDWCADQLGLGVDEMIEEVKSKMNRM